MNVQCTRPRSLGCMVRTVRKPGTIDISAPYQDAHTRTQGAGLSEPFEFARGLSVSQPDQGRSQGAHAGLRSSSSSCRSPLALEAAAWRGSHYVYTGTLAESAWAWLAFLHGQTMHRCTVLDLEAGRSITMVKLAKNLTKKQKRNAGTFTEHKDV